MAFEYPHHFTSVIYFPEGKGQDEFVSYLHTNFPMMREEGPRAVMLGYGDAVSVADAARMALECDALDSSEQKELALALLEATDWNDCARIFTEWDLEVENGELVDRREEADA